MQKQPATQSRTSTPKASYSKPTLKKEGSVDKITLIDAGGSYIT